MEYIKNYIIRLLLFLKVKLGTIKLYWYRIYYYYFFKRLDVSIKGKIFIRGGRGVNKFGSNLAFFQNCVIESFGIKSNLIIGDNCCFAYGVVIALTKRIEIGNNVWVGEYTSIRDTTHRFHLEFGLGVLEDKFSPITIGNNVWIGRGCIILPGTVISDNVIVAANSVVRGRLESNHVYGGSPAKLIKKVDTKYS
ncbi:MAG: acyltransferase [Chitinophagaceae bacterium]